MSALQSFLLAAAGLAALVGAAFVAGTAYYLAAFLTAADEAVARDHLVGVGTGLRYTFGAFAVAAGLVLPARRVLPRPLVRLLTLPAAVAGVLLLVWLGARLVLGR